MLSICYSDQAVAQRTHLLFLDTDLGRPFPHRDAIFPDESGNGYALRMADRNSLLFADLARATASIGHTYLPHSGAKRIAYWFGADPASVENAFPHRYKLGGQQMTQFFGCVFRRPYHLRYSRPQVCPMCLRENGYARGVWEISLVTCCPWHFCMLVERCPQCSRRLRWRRPGLTTCQCTADLCSYPTDEASLFQIAVSLQVERLLYHVEDDLRPGDGLGPLSLLSLDVFVRTIRALGIRDGDQRVMPGKATRILDLEEASKVVERSLNRVCHVLSGHTYAQRAHPTHNEELCAIFFEAEADERELLSLILQSIVAQDDYKRTVKNEEWQLPLF